MALSHILVGLPSSYAALPPSCPLSGPNQLLLSRKPASTCGYLIRQNPIIHVGFIQMPVDSNIHAQCSFHSTSIFFSMVVSAFFSWAFVSIIFFISACMCQRWPCAHTSGMRYSYCSYNFHKGDAFS